MAEAKPTTSSSGITVGQRRFALGLLITINLVNYIDRMIPYAIAPELQKALFGPEEKNAKFLIGTLTPAFLISYMVLAPLMGWLADRVNRWLLIGTCVLFWSLATGASGLATTFSILFLTRVLVGVGEAGYGPAAPTLIADLYPVEKRGMMMSYFYVAIPVGSALGYAIGGVAGKHWGLHGAFFSMVPLGVILALISFFTPDPRKLAGQAGAGQREEKAKLSECKVLLHNRSYIFDTLGLAAMTFSIGGISAWIPTYFNADRHAGDLDQVNIILGGITVVTGLTATVLGGIAAEKLKKRWPGAYFLVSGVGMLLAFPLFLAMLWAPFPAAWFLLAAAEFCLFFNTGPTNTILANVTSPRIRGTAFAVNIFLIHAFGDAISPMVIGRIADVSSMHNAFLAMSAIIVLGGIFWMLGARYLEEDTAKALEKN